MPATQVNLRIDPELLAKIDHNANAAGITRTEYLLQWLPETHDHDAADKSAQRRDNDR